MRITMNTLMLVKWKILSHVHSQFVPDIVGPFLKVSLITEPGEYVVVILECFVLCAQVCVISICAICCLTQIRTHAHTHTHTHTKSNHLLLLSLYSSNKKEHPFGLL